MFHPACVHLQSVMNKTFVDASSRRFGLLWGRPECATRSKGWLLLADGGSTVPFNTTSKREPLNAAQSFNCLRTPAGRDRPSHQEAQQSVERCITFSSRRLLLSDCEIIWQQPCKLGTNCSLPFSSLSRAAGQNYTNKLHKHQERVSVCWWLI